ncbi:MAG: hypothetical protein NXI09_05480 [Bacteroidetes bacterium]|nr:hypothetical protein [Bacteroidota bacterium]
MADIDNADKIIVGLESAYKKLIEFKKYKKSPIIVFKNGKVVELNAEKVSPKGNVYSK